MQEGPFAGRVRAGLTVHSRGELLGRISDDQVSRCPFVNPSGSKTGHWGEGATAEDMTKLRWVRPKIVIEVSFVERTRMVGCATRSSWASPMTSWLHRLIGSRPPDPAQVGVRVLSQQRDGRAQLSTVTRSTVTT